MCRSRRTPAEPKFRKEDDMSTPVKRLLPLLGLSIVVGSVRPVLAMGGSGGPTGFMMTKQYCTELVVSKGIKSTTDVTRFLTEVEKCVDNPVTYPTTSNTYR
jgi:hypothetical protein